MKRLGIALNTTSDDMKIHNIKLDETEKKILKLKNEFKDLFYNNSEIKNFSVKINLKEDAKEIQQKKQTNTDTPTRPSSRRNQTINKQDGNV